MELGEFALNIASFFGSETATTILNLAENAVYSERTMISTVDNEEYVILRSDQQDTLYLPSGNGTDIEPYTIVIGSEGGQTVPLDNTRFIFLDGNHADLADYSQLTGGNGINVDLSSGVATMEGRTGVKDYLGDAVIHVNGSAFADTVLGDELGNRLEGNGGNDTLDGGLGNDVLDGGNGDDLLTGTHQGGVVPYNTYKLA